MKHLDEIRILVGEKKPHILHLNETKIDGSISDDDTDIEDYALDRKDRTCFGGGVTIYVHKSIRFKKRADLGMIELEIITIELNMPFVKLIILTTIYHPESLNKIESLVSKIVSKKKEFILLGDLNCDLLSETISKTKHLVHIYNAYGLTQVIKETTRTTAETNTLIDHIVTNKNDNIPDSGIIPCGISDHDLVEIIRHARIPKNKKDPKIVTVRSHKNLNIYPLIKDLNELPFELMRASAGNSNDLWSNWKPFFLDILSKHAPVKTRQVKRDNLPNVMAEVKSMMRQRDYLRGKANKTGSKYLQQAFQHLHNRVNYTLRKLKSDYYRKKSEDNKDNNRNMSKVLKKVINRKGKCNLVFWLAKSL